MQDLAENALAFRLASELFRKEHDILRSAIRDLSPRVGVLPSEP